MIRVHSGGRSARVSALRGLVALSVVVYHVFLQARAHEFSSLGLGRLDAVVSGNMDRLGGWGVSVFLVLSGWGLVKSFEHSGPMARFASRRMRRLYPMLWWVAAPTIALAALLGALNADELWKLPFWLTGLNFLSPQLFRPLTDSRRNGGMWASRYRSTLSFRSRGSFCDGEVLPP